MDSVFKALADPSRRDLLDALRRQDGQTLSQLDAALPMSRFGVAKHLKVLEEAGLVTRVKRGRFTHHYLNALPLAEVLGRWIEPYRVAPAIGGMLDLKARLEGRMDTKPDYVLRTYIRCSQDALWDALTDADAASNYHPFTPDAVRDGTSAARRATWAEWGLAPDAPWPRRCGRRATRPAAVRASTLRSKWRVEPDQPWRRSTAAWGGVGGASTSTASATPSDMRTVWSVWVAMLVGQGEKTGGVLKRRGNESREGGLPSNGIDQRGATIPTQRGVGESGADDGEQRVL